MKDNTFTVIEDDETIEYRILLNIEDVEGKNYVVYTKDELNEDGDILSYAATYIEDENTGNIKLTSIKDDKEWEFIRDIMNSIQNEEEVK